MTGTRTIRSLGFDAPGEAGFVSYEEGPPGPGEVRLETLYTGFSAGTELTFYKNTNPYLHSRWDAERGAFVPGEAGQRFPVPFLGYMESARVVEGSGGGLAPGDVVGTTYGHKTGHTANPDEALLVKLPAGVDPILGIYAAQMGPIAANGVLHADAELIGPQVARLGEGIAGKRVVVVGAGVVGMLTALFAKQAGAEVLIADPNSFRRARAGCLGLEAVEEHEALDLAKGRWKPGADVVLQTRADSASLHNALACLRPQGAVIDLAFYQGGSDGLRLGEEFHHNGLAIRCAQIGRVPRGLADDWDQRRLAGETVKLLEARGEEIKAQLITHVVPFDEGPAFLERLVAERPNFLQIVFKVGSD